WTAPAEQYFVVSRLACLDGTHSMPVGADFHAECVFLHRLPCCLCLVHATLYTIPLSILLTILSCLKFFSMLQTLHQLLNADELCTGLVSCPFVFVYSFHS